MQRRISFAVDEYYHLYNRGTEQRDIFLNHKNYSRFSFLLYVCNSTKPVNVRDLKDEHKGLPFADIDRGDTIVDIGSWCLMPNHFHILAKEKIDGGITKFMLKLTTAYSMYFNTLNNRGGRLFQGPFQATHVGEDQYLKYLFAYIHLNPVKLIDPRWKESGISNKNAAQKHLALYPFSSYLDYTGVSRELGLIINSSAFPDYFSSNLEFTGFIEDWLSYKG